MKIHARQQQFPRNFSLEIFADKGNTRSRNTQRNYNINNTENYVRTTDTNRIICPICFGERNKTETERQMRRMIFNPR